MGTLLRAVSLGIKFSEHLFQHCWCSLHQPDSSKHLGCSSNGIFVCQITVLFLFFFPSLSTISLLFVPFPLAFACTNPASSLRSFLPSSSTHPCVLGGPHHLFHKSFFTHTHTLPCLACFSNGRAQRPKVANLSRALVLSQEFFSRGGSSGAWSHNRWLDRSEAGQSTKPKPFRRPSSRTFCSRSLDRLEPPEGWGTSRWVAVGWSLKPNTRGTYVHVGLAGRIEGYVNNIRWGKVVPKYAPSTLPWNLERG